MKLYNGQKDQPSEQELRLSDAFINPAGINSAEIKVKDININTDKAHELLKKCDVLREYSQFIDTVREHSGEKSAVKKAIRECIGRGILADDLKRKGREVENMLIAEYSYEEDIRVKQQEAEQQGRQEGLILSGKIFRTVKNSSDLTNEQVAAEVGCEPEEVESARKMFGI